MYKETIMVKIENINLRKIKLKQTIEHVKYSLKVKLKNFHAND